MPLMIILKRIWIKGKRMTYINNKKGCRKMKDTSKITGRVAALVRKSKPEDFICKTHELNEIKNCGSIKW